MGLAGRVLDLTKDQTNKYHPTPHAPPAQTCAHAQACTGGPSSHIMPEKKLLVLDHLSNPFEVGAASPPAAVDCGVGWRWGGAVSTSADARVEPALLLHLAVLPLDTQAAARADSAAT